MSSSQISDFTAWPDLLQTQDSCSGHICILFGLDDNDETGIYRNCSREGNTGTSTQHSFTFVQNTCKSFLPEEGGRHSRNSELLNMTEDQLGPLQSVKGQVEDDLCLLSPHTFLYKPGRSSSYFPHSVLASQWQSWRMITIPVSFIQQQNWSSVPFDGVSVSNIQ